MMWEFILKLLQKNADVILMAELLVLIVCGAIGIGLRASLNKRILSVTKKVEKYLAVVMENGEQEPSKMDTIAECSGTPEEWEEQNRLISDVLQEIFP